MIGSGLYKRFEDWTYDNVYSPCRDGLTRLVDGSLSMVGLARESRLYKANTRANRARYELRVANTQLELRNDLRHLFQGVVDAAREELGLPLLDWPYKEAKKGAFEEAIDTIITGLRERLQTQLPEGIQRVLSEEIRQALAQNPQLLEGLIGYNAESGAVYVTEEAVKASPYFQALEKKVRGKIGQLEGEKSSLQAQLQQYGEGTEGKGYRVVERAEAAPGEVETRVITDETLQQRVDQLERLVAWYKSRYGEQEEAPNEIETVSDTTDRATLVDEVTQLRRRVAAYENMIAAYRRHDEELQTELELLRERLEGRLEVISPDDIDKKTVEDLDGMNAEERERYNR